MLYDALVWPHIRIVGVSYVYIVSIPFVCFMFGWWARVKCNANSR